MKRKINRVGQNTLTVSLPSKWAKQRGVKQGDEVEVDDAGSSLIIHTGPKKKEKREITFNLDDKHKYMLRLLCGPYLKGYTKIKIYYTDPKEYQQIKKGLRYLVGFEVVEQGKNSVTLEEISSGTEDKFSHIITRLFYVLKSFLEEIHNYLRQPYENIHDLYDIELSCNRLSLYCRRLLNQNAVPGKVYENIGLYHVVCLIEQSADELRDIVDYFVEVKPKNYKFNKKLTPVFNDVGKVIDLTVKKVHNYMGKRDYREQLLLAGEQKKIRNKLRQKPGLFALEKPNDYIFWHLVNISESIQHMSEEFF